MNAKAHSAYALPFKSMESTKNVLFEIATFLFKSLYNNVRRGVHLGDLIDFGSNIGSKSCLMSMLVFT